MDCCVCQRNGGETHLKFRREEIDQNVVKLVDKGDHNSPPADGSIEIVELVRRTVWLRDGATGELKSLFGSLANYVAVDFQKESNAGDESDPKQVNVACVRSEPLGKPVLSRPKKSKKNLHSDSLREDLCKGSNPAGDGIVRHVDEVPPSDSKTSESSHPVKTNKSKNKIYSCSSVSGGESTPAADGKSRELESEDFACLSSKQFEPSRSIKAKQSKPKHRRDVGVESALAADEVVMEPDDFEFQLPCKGSSPAGYGIVGHLDGVPHRDSKTSELSHPVRTTESKKNLSSDNRADAAHGMNPPASPADVIVVGLGDYDDARCISKPIESPAFVKAKPKKNGSFSCRDEDAHEVNTPAAADGMEDVACNMSKYFEKSPTVKAKKLKKNRPCASPGESAAEKDTTAGDGILAELDSNAGPTDSKLSIKVTKSKKNRSSNGGHVGEDAQGGRPCAADEIITKRQHVPCSLSSQPSGTVRAEKLKKHCHADGAGEKLLAKNTPAFEGVVTALEDDFGMLAPVPLSSRKPEKSCHLSSGLEVVPYNNTHPPDEISRSLDTAARPMHMKAKKAKKNFHQDVSTADTPSNPSTAENVAEGNIRGVHGVGTQLDNVACGRSKSSVMSRLIKAKKFKHGRNSHSSEESALPRNDTPAPNGVVINLDNYLGKTTYLFKLARKSKKKRKQYGAVEDGHAGGTFAAAHDGTFTDLDDGARFHSESLEARPLLKKKRKKLKNHGHLDGGGEIGQVGSGEIVQVQDAATDDEGNFREPENAAIEIRSPTSRKKLQGSRTRQRSGEESDRGHESSSALPTDFHDKDPPLLHNPRVQKKKIRFLLPGEEVVAPEDEEQRRRRSWRYDHSTPDLRFGKFTAEEDEAIKMAVDAYIQMRGWDKVKGLEMLLNSGGYKEARCCWPSIANCLPHRPVKLINSRARRLLGDGTRGKWSEQDVDQLRKLILEHGRNWKKIGAILERPAQMCKDKWRALRLAPHIITGAWTQEERDKLLSYVLTSLEAKNELADKEGDRSRWRRVDVDWEKIAEKMHRSDKACANVWYEKISPFLLDGDSNGKLVQKIGFLKSALKSRSSFG